MASNRPAKLPNLSLEQTLPEPGRAADLNTCGDPDCVNYGIRPRSGAKTSRDDGRGAYRLVSPRRLLRTSTAIEFEDQPAQWSDGRNLNCLAAKGGGTCGSSSNMQSNAHLDAETERLAGMNGILDGPRCGSCGARYLDDPSSFATNGANGKSKSGKALGIRLVHKACRGRKGSRVTASLPHRRQQDQRQNIEILRLLVNGAGINDIRRATRSPSTGRELGVAKIYDRIFFLEAVLLAFEAAQLAQWRERLRSQGRKRHSRVSHDDLVLGVNWETSKDRRITRLNCSVSADVQSGYVFRADIDFDPRFSAAEAIGDAYLREEDSGHGLRREYRRRSGRVFTAPALHFQRETGRYDEPILFAAAIHELASWAEDVARKYRGSGMEMPPKVEAAISDARVRAMLMETIAWGYFDLPRSERDHRNSYKGCSVRSTYTKAASLHLLEKDLPSGKLTLIGEQEGSMGRVVPHVFREAILADRFEWLVVGFDKGATKPQIQVRQRKFQASLDEFRRNRSDLSAWDALQKWTAPRLTAAVKAGPDGRADPYPSSNFAAPIFPRLWIASPIQQASETMKVVGFPILSPRYRQRFRAFGIDARPATMDDDLRDAITRRVMSATLQPASSFMNALRERISPARRAGYGGARVGSGFVNGASFNPRVLIALVNIFRVHFNWFEPRPYVSLLNQDEETVPTGIGTVTRQVPGTGTVVAVPKRRRRAPIKRTPAMRAGIHVARRGTDDPPPPEIKRVLYEPWLYRGTPLWEKLR